MEKGDYNKNRAENSVLSPEEAEELERQLKPGVYGRKEIVTVNLRDLVVLSQVRNVPNPEADNLKESIKAGGLINQIDVARLDRAAFEEYVAFVNEVWGDNLIADDFPPAEDGYMYLVVAGHTRVEVIKEIEDEKVIERARRGMPDIGYGETDVKLMHDMSPDDIIALQLNENIHRQPPKERAATAVVEAYLYGLKVGKWANKAEFLRNSERKFSRSTLNDALHFAELPQHIRDFVLGGGIQYRAGVELGKTLPVFREYSKLKYFDGAEPSDMEPELRTEYENGVLEWLGAEVASIQHARMKGRFTGAIITGRYETYRREFSSFIDIKTGKTESDQLQFEMADTLADWRQNRRRLRERYALELREISAQPLGRLATLVGHHMQLWEKTGSDPSEIEGLVHSVESNYVMAVKRAAGTVKDQ